MKNKWAKRPLTLTLPGLEEERTELIMLPKKKQRGGGGEKEKLIDGEQANTHPEVYVSTKAEDSSASSNAGDFLEFKGRFGDFKGVVGVLSPMRGAIVSERCSRGFRKEKRRSGKKRKRKTKKKKTQEVGGKRLRPHV